MSAKNIIDIGIDTAELRRRYYEAGQSLNRIAKSLGVSATTIARRLEAAQIPRRTSREALRINPPRPRIDIGIDTAELRRRYEAGQSVNRIAKSLGVAARTIERRLDEAQIPRRSRREALRHRRTRPRMDIGIDATELRRRYEAGELIVHIAHSLGVSTTTVRRRMVEAGIKRRHPNDPRSRTYRKKVAFSEESGEQVTAEEMTDRFEAGETFEAISKTVDISTQLVRLRIREVQWLRYEAAQRSGVSNSPVEANTGD
ncbi:hypothetical protein ACQP2T_60120 [Nonomuraea sp. CA-143628]|uniref:hypothetical protein n=1 Tax=Nonomuraea sp. CA-143628 TaxID=3239997 RepID=UPI003D8D4BB9